MDSSSGIIIFIKNPVLGQVKTRLAKTLGNIEALRIYLELCKITRNAIENINCSKYLFYSEEIIDNDAWPLSEFTKYMQRGVDLGERMSNAFRQVFSHHQHLVLIGSDCPYICSKHIQQAFLSLKNTDCVLGPAVDGGYYLIGLKEMIPDLFINKKWSSDILLTQTLESLKIVKKSVFKMETLSDIDDSEDWQSYCDFKNLTKS